ncbi:MAG: biopolymer transporter ExbD [Gammaproteobacteria bacterium]|nr:biopolymer transporter ExbD [Gammaproteobacteria bacterium]
MLLDLVDTPRRQLISLTPLIDVVFILLLFFMLSSSFIQWREIALIAPSETELPIEEPILRVLKLEENSGLFSFSGRQFFAEDRQQVTAFVHEDSAATYVITVEPGVNVQAMITLLDSLKQAGATKVSLAEVLP